MEEGMFSNTQSLLRLLLMLTLLSFAAVTPAPGGIDAWTSIGPTGGRVLALAVDPSNKNVVYGGTDGGIFKSTNGGKRWTSLNNAINIRSNSLSAHGLAIDPTAPDTVYAGVANTIFKSTNAGL